MGAWDVGPLDNDDARDCICDVEDILKQSKKYQKDPELFMKDFYEKLGEPGEEDDECWATEIMAFTEWLFCRNYNLKPHLQKINNAVDIAIKNAYSRSVGWVDPEERKKAMLEFKEKINE